MIHSWRSRQTRQVFGRVHSNNVATLRLARALGFEVDLAPGVQTAVVSIDLHPEKARLPRVDCSECRPAIECIAEDRGLRGNSAQRLSQSQAGARQWSSPGVCRSVRRLGEALQELSETNATSLPIGGIAQSEHMGNVTEYLRFIVTLTAVVDPFLAVPFFIAFTRGRNAEDRARLARIVAVTVFLVLTSAVFVGEALLHLIGASLPAFRVGGGLVLLLMALAMLNAEAGAVRHSQAEAHELESGDMSGVVPIAIPLLAGPGAISTAIIAAERVGLTHQLVLICSIALVCLVSWAVLSRAHAIARRLSLTALNIATRILGLLLAAMAVQTIADGLKGLFPGLAA
jgi:multiple antibiotic resistance protein